MKLLRSDLELEAVVRRIRAGELDLQPDFQRGEIWDLKRRQRLIDTVLRAWYIPAIHIVIDTDGNEVVLDGQQRLVAIRDFFQGEFKVKGQIEPYDETILSLDGLKYNQLPETVRRRINRFTISIVTMSEFAPQEPNELFFRLNQSYNLTPPEKRNALHGEARDQVKRLVEDLQDSGLLVQTTIGFSNSRLAYDDVIARTCVAIATRDLRKHINNNTVEEYYRKSPFDNDIITSLREAGRLLLAQIQAHHSKIRFNKGTLQTWLIFCCAALDAATPLPVDMLSKFEEARVSTKASLGHHELPLLTAIQTAIRTYEDRAAYRVTDVSSVVLRDACLHVFALADLGWQNTVAAQQLLGAFIDARPQNEILHLLAEIEWGLLSRQNGAAS